MKGATSQPPDGKEESRESGGIVAGTARTICWAPREQHVGDCAPQYAREHPNESPSAAWPNAAGRDEPIVRAGARHVPTPAGAQALGKNAPGDPVPAPRYASRTMGLLSVPMPDDFDLAHIAVLHVGGGALGAHPDHVAGIQRQVMRHRHQEIHHAEEHVVGAELDHLLAVHPHLGDQAFQIDIGLDPRPHRLERIGVLGAPQRAIAALPRALADSRCRWYSPAPRTARYRASGACICGR